MAIRININLEVKQAKSMQECHECTDYTQVYAINVDWLPFQIRQNYTFKQLQDSVKVWYHPGEDKYGIFWSNDHDSGDYETWGQGPNIGEYIRY